MRDRCNNPSHRSYKNYGGRGIKVCERWNDFTNFIADMSDRPPGTMLDRYPDNDGNYGPGNVRWATRKESNENRRPYKTRVGRSGLRGVRQFNRRWRAGIYYKGKNVHLGTFDSPERANAAYLIAAKKLRSFRTGETSP
jgi:hypothetical protein